MAASFKLSQDSKYLPQPATEIAPIPLKPGTRIDEGDGKKSVEEMFATLKELPGFKFSFYGVQKENPDVMDLVIDWEKLQDHINFMKSDLYQTFGKRLADSIMSGLPALSHAQFTLGDISTACSAPVTEMLMIYLPSASDDFESTTWKPFITTLSENAQGFVGAAGGYCTEIVEYQGEKGLSAYVAAIGWQSVDAHMAYRETEAFKGSIGSVRGQAKGLSVHHTSFTRVDKA